MKTRVIHIGFPKTATTTLQNGLFRQHPQIAYLRTPEVMKAVMCDILSKESVMYSPRRTREAFAPGLEQFERDAAKKMAVFSYEGIAFSPDGTYADRRLIAERLKDIFGEAMVLIAVRSQAGFLKSIYGEYVKRSGLFIGFERFLEYQYWKFDTYAFSQLYYSRLIQAYRDIFGADKVKMILFEEFIKNPQAGNDKLCDTFGISRFALQDGLYNPALRSSLMTMMRAFNFVFRNNYGRPYFFPYTTGLIEKGFPHANFEIKGMAMREKIRHELVCRLEMFSRRFPVKNQSGLKIPDKWQKIIAELYAEDNTRLSRMCGLDLRKWKYPVLESITEGTNNESSDISQPETAVSR